MYSTRYILMVLCTPFRSAIFQSEHAVLINSGIGVTLFASIIRVQ